jgi:alpha,alpha-trehalase
MRASNDRERFPPIEDYGMLSDGEVIALVASSGSVEWLCAPRMDSPSVFAAILDRRAGHFRVGPRETRVPASRRYLPGTLILETTWMTTTGWLVVCDALLVGPWADDPPDVPPYSRAARPERAEHVLLRTLHCDYGFVEIEADCRPVFDYGRQHAEWTVHAGSGHATARGNGGVPLELVATVPLEASQGSAGARIVLQEGEGAAFGLSWGGARPPSALGEADERLARTLAYWRNWLAGGSFPDHPWRQYLQRSALVLKGLIYAPTGAMLAAATTSLPEAPGGERNWDYRYTWIRDATFALWGLYTLGLNAEADDFMRFVADVAGGERETLHIMYAIDGAGCLPEVTLDHLSGYNGARPVRIGNDAYGQSQHDVWGMLLDSIYLHASDLGDLPERMWPVIERQVEQALEHWRDPDHGIWEVRGEPQHFTSSKLLCWVAADRGARLASRRGARERAAEWHTAAEEIHADICRNGVDERGVFVQHYGTTALDASCLLFVLMRFLPPEDARIVATINAIAEELTEEEHVLRYRVDETDDGMEGDEGTFVICSFWLVSALAEIGELARAAQLCEKLLTHASSLGLYAEELDPHTGHHLGNFPQAFSHLALINAVTHVIRGEKRTERPGRFEPAAREAG